jgi:hypothetical protein
VSDIDLMVTFFMKIKNSIIRELQEYRAPGYRSRKEAKKLSEFKKQERRTRKVKEKEDFKKETKDIKDI